MSTYTTTYDSWLQQARHLVDKMPPSSRESEPKPATAVTEAVLTDALNIIYDGHDSSLDPVLAYLQHLTLSELE